MSLRLATVLKSGPEFKAEYLVNMVDGVLKFNPDMEVCCLTDCDIDHPKIKSIPLLHGWRGWWSKLELFRPGLFDGPTIYLDIDTVVIGKLALPSDRFTMLRDVYRRNSFGSGAMGWHTPPSYLYEKFARCPGYFMRSFVTRSRWGDQGFIEHYLKEIPDTFGTDFRSFKVHCNQGVPENTNVVYFHGKPRPWHVNLELQNLQACCDG